MTFLRRIANSLWPTASNGVVCVQDIVAIEKSLIQARMAIGRSESRVVRAAEFEDPRQAEFQVFSQWGEDGIIQYLLGKIPVPEKTFVEFGVEDYSESNTRFLLSNDNWRGIIIDGGDRHLQFLKRTGLGWRYDITAIQAFVDRENINTLLTSCGLRGDIGLLSVDIDGNDYWVLEAITKVSPRIVIAEYNSVFGNREAVSVPYRADFQRYKAHHSNLYYGASIGALCHWGATRGYSLVCTNSAGNNAFFVRDDVRGSLRPLSAAEGWMASRFRESRDLGGGLTHLASHADRIRAIADCPLVDVISGRPTRVGDLVSG